MKIINAYCEILQTPCEIAEIPKKIERAARICYKSESNITDDSAERMVRRLISSHHEAMLEHEKISVKFVCNRAIANEIVRHRVASYAQESTRYCNYANDKFDNEITVIKPCFFVNSVFKMETWKNAMKNSEKAYFTLLKNGATPEEARGVLPLDLKTEIIVTMNIREWRHFFKLRALGETGKPHPQMLEISVPLLDVFQKILPCCFDDLRKE